MVQFEKICIEEIDMNEHPDLDQKENYEDTSYQELEEEIRCPECGGKFKPAWKREKQKQWVIQQCEDCGREK